MAEGTNWEEEPTSSVRSKTDTGPNSTIINFFTKCEDYQLFLLTQFYWDELEQAVEKGVDELSSLLTDQRVFSGQEHRQIINLEEKGDISESCKLLLSLVMEKGSGARLVMWESFVKMRHGVPKLDKMLKEIQEHGPDPLDSMRMCRSKSKAPSQLKDWKIESATAVAKKASGMKAGKCRRIHSSDLDTFDFITKEVVQQKHKQTLWVQTETLRVNTIQIKDKVKIFQLVDRYAELTIHSIVRDRTLGEHELLASGRDNEQWRETHLLRKELETIQTDQLFQDSFCERMAKRFRKISGSSAAVSGIPGIGKTTMVQKIVYDWATGKIYPHFQFVFSFKFRDLNTIDCRINLRNLILIFYPYFGNVVKELWKNPEGLLFIFDGLDEFKDRIDFSDNRRITEPQSMCTDPECWCEVSDIVYSLIQHKLLPGCSVLVTSRPTALHLLEKAEISVWAEILGFVGDERKEYFNRFFEDQAVASAVCNHLEENEILYTMCYNPSYCLMLGLSLGPFFTQRDRKQQEVPKTITQLYSYYIYNILKNHGREIENPRDVLLKLGEIAFTGISEKKSVFGNGDLIEYNLQPSQFLSGYLMEILERDVSLQSGVYTFPHLTIQQFIAALAQFLTPDPADIRKLLTEAHSKNDGQFELFLHFVFGLSSPEAAQPLEELLGQFLHQTTYQVFDWVKERFIGSIGNRVNETEKRNLLNTFQYVIESQNEALTQATMGSERTLTLCGLRLTPINCTVLSHVIGLCDKIRHLDLEYCYIQFEGLQRLVSILHKCRELRLKKNNLGDPGVKLLCVALRNPDCKIQDIGLEENELTDSCVEDLASVLITNVSLTDLKLGYNRLGDSGVKQLTMALMNPNCKIKTLGLEENRLTDHCAGDLASTLSTNRSLTDLKLGFNRLGDSGMKILCVALRNPDCKLQTLWLYRNDITVYSAKDLFATLNTNQSLEILNLNQNDLGGLGVKLLSEFLRKPECKIRKLGLSAVGLTDSYVEDLASALSTNQLLTDLNLGYNKVGDAGVKLLSVALRNQNCTIQELGLNNNSLTDSCTEDLSSALSRNRSVRVLDLKSNSFTDRSVPALRYLILTCRSLKSIRLCENKFRSKGKRHLELMWGSRPGMSVTL